MRWSIASLRRQYATPQQHPNVKQTYTFLIPKSHVSTPIYTTLQPIPVLFPLISLNNIPRMRTIHIHPQLNNHIPLKPTNPTKFLPIPPPHLRFRLRSMFHRRPIPTYKDTRDLPLDGGSHTCADPTERVFQDRGFIVVACEGVRMAGDGPGYVGGDVGEEGLVVGFFEGAEYFFDCFEGEHYRCGDVDKK